MKSTVFFLVAVALLLLFGAGPLAAEPPNPQALEKALMQFVGDGPSAAKAPADSAAAATLHLANGDYLAGELLGCAGTVSSGSAAILRWQGSAFVTPLDFPLSAVSAVSFPARGPRPHPDGPYCLELEGGDALFGNLVGLSSQEVQFDAPGLGLLHIQRSAVQRIWHCREGADQIYLGPNGLLEWKASPSGAWEQDAGRLFTTRDGASLVGELGVPAQACLDFELSWTSEPDFSWIMGTSADSAQDDQAFHLEVWGHQLVLFREMAQKANLVPLQKITPGAGRCHFRIYLDQEHNRAIVIGADGGLLAELAVLADLADAPPHSGTPIHAGLAAGLARLVHQGSADAGSHSGPGLRLINHHGNVRLEQLSIARWDGQPPRDEGVCHRRRCGLWKQKQGGR
jgi:hypothetical protein